MSAKSCKIKKLLNLGSSCMYPTTVPNPLTENSLLKGPLEPTNEGYAIAKLVVTKLCQYINSAEPQYQYKTLIPCNLYGRHDKFGAENAHLIPAIINKIHHAHKNREKVVCIWGDGTVRREFLYAGDLADAILHAANDLIKLPSIMNIGTGIDHTVSDYYKITAQIFGWDGNFTYDKSKPSGMSRKLNDISLQEQWGWKPKTSIYKGIETTIKFFKENEV
tara:strand:+ start:13 stop:672 length:660 start_codon:yes stop_codon:yes gene_type:complete